MISLTDCLLSENYYAAMLPELYCLGELSMNGLYYCYFKAWTGYFNSELMRAIVFVISSGKSTEPTTSCKSYEYFRLLGNYAH
jgi:hypothetical protein